MNRPEEEIDLATAALLIAREEYQRLQIPLYLNRLDRMAEEIAADLGAKREPHQVIQHLNFYLFVQQGFQGNREEYYDPRNSFLNEVLDRKTGIPITLSLLYMELGKRLGVSIAGIGLPGHFIVGYQTGTAMLLIDPFHRGKILEEKDCAALLTEIYGQRIPFQKSFLTPVTPKQFLTRMLNNLKSIYIHLQELGKAITTVEYLLMVNPHAYEELRDRGMLHYQMKAYPEALSDLVSYLNSLPEARDASLVQRNITALKQLIGMLN